MVIQSESRPGFNSAYQVQASHLAAPGGYGGHAHGGHAHHGGHAPYMKPSGPLGGVLLGGGPLGGGPGYSSSTSNDHFSQHGGPSGNVQSYTNFESSKYSGGAQPHLHGGAGYGSYGSSAPCHGGLGGRNRVESSTFAYTNSDRPAHTPGQESWNFKSIDD